MNWKTKNLSGYLLKLNIIQLCCYKKMWYDLNLWWCWRKIVSIDFKQFLDTFCMSTEVTSNKTMWLTSVFTS